MKKLSIIIAVLLLNCFNANSQQDPLVTQYMFNGLYINPAYAGSHQYWSSTMTYRSQWSGAEFEGAPETAIAAIDGPILGKNMGLGILFVHDRIGVTRQNAALANYAYQLRLNSTSKLSFGISAGLSQYTANRRDVLIWEEQDLVYANNTSVILPRVGLGAYYYSKRHYIGISIPTLLAYDKGEDFNMDLSRASFLRRHYLLTAGIVLDVAKRVKLKPSVLVKYVESAPMEGDINLSAVLNDALWLGVSYRTDDAVALIFEYQTKSYFRIGYSYDITLTNLRSYSNGSHEIMIGVDFGKDLKKIKTPRYF